MEIVVGWSEIKRWCCFFDEFLVVDHFLWCLPSDCRCKVDIVNASHGLQVGTNNDLSNPFASAILKLFLCGYWACCDSLSGCYFSIVGPIVSKKRRSYDCVLKNSDLNQINCFLFNPFNIPSNSSWRTKNWEEIILTFNQ